MLSEVYLFQKIYRNLAVIKKGPKRGYHCAGSATSVLHRTPQ